MTGFTSTRSSPSSDEDEEPPEHADLRGGEPDAARLVHQRGHALDEPLEVVVEALDLARLHAENRVAVLPDPRERQQATRLALELLLVLGVIVLVIVVVLVLVLVIVVVVGHRAASLAAARWPYRPSLRCPSAAAELGSPPASRAITAIGPTPSRRSDFLNR